jgi:hypothetical protein
VILTVLTLDYCCCFGALKGNGRYYFFVLAICFFAKHIQNGYRKKAKSNSLLYLYNDTGKANWATYDKISRFVDERLPRWKSAADLNEYPLFSKYNSGFTYATPARKKSCNTNYSIPWRSYRKIKIFENKNTQIEPNRYDIFANEKWLSTILLLMVRLH